MQGGAQKLHFVSGHKIYYWNKSVTPYIVTWPVRISSRFVLISASRRSIICFISTVWRCSVLLRSPIQRILTSVVMSVSDYRRGLDWIYWTFTDRNYKQLCLCSENIVRYSSYKLRNVRIAFLCLTSRNLTLTEKYNGRKICVPVFSARFARGTFLYNKYLATYSHKLMQVPLLNLHYFCPNLIIVCMCEENGLEFLSIKQNKNALNGSGVITCEHTDERTEKI
jgi:hypothetical protein